MKRKKVYKNGATLIFKKCNLKCTSVAVGIVFGENRDNYSEPTAHFCEHMLFNETENYSKKQLKEEIQNIFSGNINANTSLFRICFHFSRANKALVPCFKLASEMILNTKFTKKIIDNEKGVIKQEALRRDDNNQMKIYFTTIKTLRDKYNKSSIVLGNEEEIDSMTLKELKAFRDETFISQNFCIAIVGDSFRKAKKLAYKYFISKLKSNPDYPVNKTINYPITKEGNMLVEKIEGKKLSCKITIKIDNNFSAEMNEICMIYLSKYLTGLGGKLYALIRENGLAYVINMENDFSPDNQCVGFYFESSSENFNKIIEIIGETIKTLRKQKIEEKYIENIKSNYFLNKDETVIQPYTEARAILNSYLTFGDRVTSKTYTKKYNKIFKSITPEMILDFCKDVFSKPENIYVSVVDGSEKNNFYSYEKIQNLFTNNK